MRPRIESGSAVAARADLPSRAGRRARALCGAASMLALAVTTLVLAPGIARAEYRIGAFTTSVSDTRAGAHADVGLRFTVEEDGAPPTATDLRDVIVDLPAGVLGDPSHFVTCPPERVIDNVNPCPAASQVGEFAAITEGPDLTQPIYLVAPPRGIAARLAFQIFGTVQYLDIKVRNGEDYGLRAISRDLVAASTVQELQITLWGVPADHNGSGAERRPFMVNPTSCDVAPVTRLRINTYSDPTYLTAEHRQDAPTDCVSLAFAPSANIRLLTDRVDTPTGLAVDLAIPQNDDPDGRATPALRDVVVELPEGVGINPPVARDLAGCSDAAFERTQDSAPACPASSKIGSVAFDVPALPEPLHGDVYLAEPVPGDPYRLFLYAPGYGVRVKLQGSIQPDPDTGRIKAIFRDNPQVPVRRIAMHLRSGPNAALVSPMRCGPVNTMVTFASWSGAVRSYLAQSYVNAGPEGGPCDETLPFMPHFTAGSTGAGAGQDTGFVVRFLRPDGHEDLSKLTMHLPAGLLGRLTAATPCPSAAADAAACGDASLVGEVRVSAGSGDAPLTLPGKVWIAEPHRPGDIASLAIFVPARVGPFDLGDVVVRAGIRVNPDTSLTVESEPMPTVLQGVPLRLKQVLVDLDLPGFMLNPTNCSPKVIAGSIISASGREVGVASPFAVRGCVDLPFEPKMSMAVTAPDREQRVGLTVDIAPRRGDANLRVVDVTLPAKVGARLDGPLQSPCLASAWSQDACPDAALVGTAIARTPVLPEPLAGKVWLLENASGEGGLPRLAIRLKGAVSIDLVGDVSVTRDGRVRTVFEGIPDVPIDGFQLRLASGEQAPLTAAGICRGSLKADHLITAHSGRQHGGKVRVTVTGCPSRTTSSKAKQASKGKSAKGKDRTRARR